MLYNKRTEKITSQSLIVLYVATKYTILSKHNFKFEDYINKDKVLNTLDDYYNNNQ